MLIKVNPKRGFWGFGQLWLTFESDPVDIDLDKASDEARAAVERALISGDLFVVNDRGEPIPYMPRPKSEQKQSVERQSKVVQDRIHTAIDKTILVILDNGMKKIREYISEATDVRFLNRMIELEKEGKNRKSLIKILEARIRSVNSLKEVRNKFQTEVEKVPTDGVMEEEEEQIQLTIER